MPGFELTKRLAEIEDPRVFVKVGQTLRIHRPMHRNHQPLAPAQMQQALGVIGVVVGLENTVEASGWKTLGEIGQTAVDQPTLIATLDQRATGQTPQAGVAAGQLASDTFATVHRHLPGITGAKQGQAHRVSPFRHVSKHSTVRSSAPELSIRHSPGMASAIKSALKPALRASRWSISASDSRPRASKR